MTREHLEAVYDAFVEIIDDSNGAAADDDRGRANDALCLTFFDDGCGRLGRRRAGSNEVEDWHDFNNADEFIRMLESEGGIELEATP